MKNELMRLVKTFRKKTCFNLFFFSTEYDRLFKQLTRINNSSQGSTKRFVRTAVAQGGRNLYDPLEESLEDPWVDTIYRCSDGSPSSGKYTREEDILRRVRRINHPRGIQINTISIGTDSKLMRRLAAQNGGFWRFLK